MIYVSLILHNVRLRCYYSNVFELRAMRCGGRRDYSDYRDYDKNAARYRLNAVLKITT